MKQSQKQAFKLLAIFLSLISMETYGQTQKKTYSESFDVTADAVLDINTSHADIEFETWNKNKVVIEATITIEGASEEEAKDYFENGGFEIMGNSSRITVNTGNHNSWSVQAFDAMGDLDIELPPIPEFESFEFDFNFSDLEDLPRMPPVPNPNFDHEAFKKDGEKYLKEWQKSFQKGFGEPYQQRMEEWQRKMEGKRHETEERREEIHEKRVEAHGERMEKHAEERVAHDQKGAEAHQRRMADYQALLAERNVDRAAMRGKPNIFYFNSEGENRNYKVKKTIKIKMPKSTKIKMNVRHGEVKLAENTNNIDATLSHASLLAATIDGDKTMVMASYSPVSVEKWNYGQLQTDYSENVDLKEVLNLRLNANSSEVTIENLLKTAFIKNSFGPLLINTISRDFETLDVSLQHAELVCDLPETAFTVYVNGTKSKFTGPAELALHRTTDFGRVVHEGYSHNKDSGKSILINSNYSEVVLE